MALIKEEQETIIVWNQAEKIAVIEVPNGSALQRRLEKIGAEKTGQYKHKGKIISKVYEVPSGWVKINPPRKISEKQRKALSERAKENLVKGE